MMDLNKNRCGIFAVCAALLMTGCGASVQTPISENTEVQSQTASEQEEREPEIILKLATTKLEDTDAYKGLENFKSEIEEQSGGTIQIILYPNSQLGSQETTAEAIELGTVEMGFVPM